MSLSIAIQSRLDWLRKKSAGGALNFHEASELGRLEVLAKGITNPDDLILNHKKTYQGELE